MRASRGYAPRARAGRDAAGGRAGRHSSCEVPRAFDIPAVRREELDASEDAESRKLPDPFRAMTGRCLSRDQESLLGLVAPVAANLDIELACLVSTATWHNSTRRVAEHSGACGATMLPLRISHTGGSGLSPKPRRRRY